MMLLIMELLPGPVSTQEAYDVSLLDLQGDIAKDISPQPINRSRVSMSSIMVLVRDPEDVGLDFLVFHDVLGFALADQPSRVHHQDPVRIPGDDVHVMFDDQG